MKIKKYIIGLLLLSYAPFSVAQKLLLNNKYSVESSLFLSTSDRLPFWLRSNQYGEVPLESQFLQLVAEMQHEYDSTFNKSRKLNKFSYGYGARAIVNVGKVNQFRLTEGFAKVRYGPFEFYGGRRREIVGLVDTTMTSGSYIWSGNALPLPKVQVSIPNYTPILGDGLLSIKGSFAHGWFGSTDSVKNYFLHQKTFYARLGKPSWKVKIYGGFNHQVQWGGRPTNPFFDKRTNQTITSFPSDFKNYLNVVTGVSLNKDGASEGGTNGVPYNEAFNRAGNHLGTLDLGFELINRFGDFLIYRQNIYDDGSLFYLNNIQDGLLGISYTPKNPNVSKNLIIKKINFEYLNTTNQGGSSPKGGGALIPELRGRDNYFNNSLYVDGYTYAHNTIGTPFIMPISSYNQLLEPSVANSINSNYHLFNRVKSSNIRLLASSGSKLDLSLRYSYFITLGHYSYPVRKNQHSFAYRILYQGNNNIKYLLAVSFDNGSLSKNQIGTMISIKKTLF